LNLVIVGLGVGLSITLITKEYDNIVSIALSALSGILLGLGLAKVRILCSFKTVRDINGEQYYSYLMPLFFTLLISQLLIPAFMLPSIAYQEIDMI
jgi:hypothetical protein